MGNNLPVPSTDVAVRTPVAADLNQVRTLMTAAQTRGELVPAVSRRVTVGRHGDIYTGNAPASTPVSKVQHGVFAADPVRAAANFASTHMPPSTRLIDTPDMYGYLYTFLSQMGTQYTMFAWHDGTAWQVKLVDPPLEGRFDGHAAHLFVNGKLCLSGDAGAGQPTLEEAWSKSVLWATGMDVVQHGLDFPFSIETH